MKRNDFASSPTSIANKTKLNYNSCREYLQLMTFVQSIPKIKIIKTEKGELYRMDGLLDLPTEKTNESLVNDFGMKLTDSDKLYLGLFEKNITNKEHAIKLGNSQIVKDGLKFRHLEKTPDGRIYLSVLGKTIAIGAKELFGKN